MLALLVCCGSFWWVSLWGQGLWRGADKTAAGRPPPPRSGLRGSPRPLPPSLSSFPRCAPTVCTQHAFLLDIYVYTHPYTYIVWFPLSFLFLRNQTTEVIPQQMSEMYYCKVYFFYNVVYHGMKGDRLPVSRARPGAGPRKGLLIVFALSPGSNKRPRKQLAFCLTPVCLLPARLLAWCRVLAACLGLPPGLGDSVHTWLHLSCARCGRCSSLRRLGRWAGPRVALCCICWASPLSPLPNLPNQCQCPSVPNGKGREVAMGTGEGDTARYHT